MNSDQTSNAMNVLGKTATPLPDYSVRQRQPETSPAKEFMKSLNRLVVLYNQVYAEKGYELYYAGFQGVFRVVRIGEDEDNFLRIRVDDSGHESDILSPVSQCAVRFVPCVDVNSPKAPGVILGFSPNQALSPVA